MSLQERATLGEITATLTVILSIVFVGYGVYTNNQIVMATKDNFIYELQDELYTEYATNKDLASIQIKLTNGEGLTDLENYLFTWKLWRHASLWEMARDRYREGLLCEEKWVP